MLADSVYRWIRAIWYASTDARRHPVCVPATEYQTDDGSVSVPYVTLLRLHNCPIERHEVIIETGEVSKYKFVVFVGEHTIKNTSVRALDPAFDFAGEVIVFRASKTKTWNSLINVRASRFESKLADAAVKQ